MKLSYFNFHRFFLVLTFISLNPLTAMEHDLNDVRSISPAKRGNYSQVDTTNQSVQKIFNTLDSISAQLSDQIDFIEEQENKVQNGEIDSALFGEITREDLNKWILKTKLAMQKNKDNFDEIRKDFNSLLTDKSQITTLFERLLNNHFEYLLNRRNLFIQFIENPPGQRKNIPFTHKEIRKNHAGVNKWICQNTIDRFSADNLILKLLYLHLNKQISDRAYKLLALHPTLQLYFEEKLDSFAVPDSQECFKAAENYEILILEETLQSRGFRVQHKIILPESNRLTKEQKKLAKRKERKESKKKNKEIVKQSLERARQLNTILGDKHNTEKEAKRQYSHAQNTEPQKQNIKVEYSSESIPQFEVKQPHEIEKYTPEHKDEKVKTRGKADPSYIASSSSSSSADLPVGQVEVSKSVIPSTLHSQKYKLLEKFWTAQAGFSYDDFKTLFESLGGKVIENKGGSSHVKLEFTHQNGHTFISGTWRPHPYPIYGYHGLADLKKFFAQCGLELKNFTHIND